MSTMDSPSILPTDQTPSINNLPVEVLSIIFRFAGPTIKRADLEDFLKIHCIRRTLCSVCSLWNAIIVSIPHLWKVIVAFVDIPDYWRTVGNQIKLSHDLPLVLVLARYRSTHVHDFEAAHVQKMLALAVPHFPRLWILHIDVHFSSSLPSIEEHPIWDMPGLVSLTLQCDCDDGPSKIHDKLDNFANNLSILHSISPSGTFSCPRLQAMTVDGANFRYMCQNRPEWIRDLRLSHLTVSHLAKNDAFDAHHLDLNDLGEFFSNTIGLQNVKFDDVYFYFDPDDPPTELTLSVLSLELKDLPGHLPVEFFHIEDTETVSIRNCALDFEFVAPLFCHQLNLEGVDIDGHLPLLFQSWRAFTISFTNCPGFNDAVLDAMGGDPNDIYVSDEDCIEKLVLTGCSNFSVEALKRMVERRNSTVDYTDPDWWACVESPEIESIVVCGHGSELSAADRQWFQSRLSEFFWDGVGHCHGALFAGSPLDIMH